MRQIESDALVDFAEIYDESVELISVSLPEATNLRWAIALLLQRPGLQAQWIQGPKGNAQPVGSGRSEDTNRALQALRDDIDLPVDLLGELLGSEACGVRIKVLEGPMCPRFHVDKVPCRMLKTYAGPATEWIAHEQVDSDAVRAGHPQPTLPGGHIQQLATGAWSLLKGGTWDGDFGGVVHRSPSSRERRLLISLDPIFSD
jgi:hypothetical protein